MTKKLYLYLLRADWIWPFMDENYLGNYTMTKHQHLRLLKSRAINLQPWYLSALQYILHILHHFSPFPRALLAQRHSFTPLPKTITPPKATSAFKVYGREWAIQHFERAAHVWHRGAVGQEERVCFTGAFLIQRPVVVSVDIVVSICRASEHPSGESKHQPVPSPRQRRPIKNSRLKEELELTLIIWWQPSANVEEYLAVPSEGCAPACRRFSATIWISCQCYE